MLYMVFVVNSSPPGQIGCYVADDIFRCIFVNEKSILIEISLKCVPTGPIDNEQWTSIGLNDGLAPDRRQAIIWNNVDSIHWRIYEALGGDELIVSVAIAQVI